MILKQKKGFLLRDFIVVTILFGMVIAFYIIQVLSIAQNYNNNDIIDPDFQAHYSRFQTNIDRLGNVTNTVQGSGGLSFAGTFEVAFNSVFTVIVMVWDSILIYTGMASNIAGDFSFIDSTTSFIFFTGLIAVITTFLIFIWLSSVSRGKI